MFSKYKKTAVAAPPPAAAAKASLPPDAAPEPKIMRKVLTNFERRRACARVIWRCGAHWASISVWAAFISLYYATKSNENRAMT